MHVVIVIVTTLVTLWIGRCLIILYKFVQNARDQIRVAKNFPGGNNRTHWLYGDFLKDKKNGISQMVKEYRDKALNGARVCVRWFPLLQPSFMVMHPDPARDILATAEPKSKRLHGSYAITEPWLGDGLLLSSGKKWERNRRLLTPAFHFNILKTYFNIYNEAASEFVESIRKCSETDEYVDVPQLSALFTLDVILRCAFSYKGDIQKHGINHPYASANLKLAHLVVKRIQTVCPEFIYKLTSTGREFNRLIKYVHEFSQNIINKRRDELKKHPDLTGKKHLDFLDILLTARDSSGDGLSNTDIRAEVDTFLFEGHDTTGSLVTFSLYCLAKYPDIQAKVRNEISSILNGRSFVTFEDVSNFNYTLLFMKEVLRMYAPVPSISRDLSKPLEIDGTVLPANSRINIAIHHLHYNSDYWDSPLEFIPERFSSEKWMGNQRHPFMHVPFSAGPRNCIGQNLAVHEEKVMLCHILKNYEISLKPDHEVEISHSLVLRSANGVPLKFTAIQ